MTYCLLIERGIIMDALGFVLFGFILLSILVFVIKLGTSWALDEFKKELLEEFDIQIKKK